MTAEVPESNHVENPSMRQTARYPTDPAWATLTHNRSELANLVGEAIGSASMCWGDLTYAGNFDGDRAVAITNEVLAKVHELTIDDEHLLRQIIFSRTTFGPGSRHNGIIEHIRKELEELEKARGWDVVHEWVDVIILGLDGGWRAIEAMRPSMTDAEIAAMLIAEIKSKQAVNEGRTWPDFKTIPADQAIEHDRTDEEPDESAKVGSDTYVVGDLNSNLLGSVFEVERMEYDGRVKTTITDAVKAIKHNGDGTTTLFFAHTTFRNPAIIMALKEDQGLTLPSSATIKLLAIFVAAAPNG